MVTVASVLAEVATITGVALIGAEDATSPSIASRRELRLIPKLIVSLTDKRYKGARRPAHLKGSWVGWQEDSGSQDSSEVGLNCAQKAEVYCAH